MFNVDRMSDFIASMPGESAEVTKTALQSMEREIREGRAAKAMLRANGIVGDVCIAIGDRKPIVFGVDVARSAA